MKDKLRLLAEQTGNPALGTFTEEEPSENVLVYSRSHEIYILDGERPVEIAERDSLVRSLASHNGVLYETGKWSEIFETLTGEKIAKRDDQVRSLASHNGVLYDGGLNGIYETLTGVKIAEREVKSLVSHEGVLYDCGASFDDGVIYETLTGEKVLVRDGVVSYLVSHNEKLYDAEFPGSHGNDFKLYETFSGDLIAERDGSARDTNPFIHSLVSYEGTLYDCGNYGLLETLTEERIVEGIYILRAMASVPRRIFAEAGIL